jgi:predicted HTH transcriptional regulator
MTDSTPSNSLTPGKAKDTKKRTEKKYHNTAQTSIECFTIIKKAGQIKREKEIVLNAITLHQPITSRELSYITGKERGNITRSIFDLIKAKKVISAFTDKCKTTNKRVQYYSLIDWVKAEIDGDELTNDSGHCSTI